jgi:hypothetical protein
MEFVPGGKVDHQIRGSKGYSPLHYAAELDRNVCAEILVSEQYMGIHYKHPVLHRCVPVQNVARLTTTDSIPVI